MNAQNSGSRAVWILCCFTLNFARLSYKKGQWLSQCEILVSPVCWWSFTKQIGDAALTINGLNLRFCMLEVRRQSKAVLLVK